MNERRAIKCIQASEENFHSLMARASSSGSDGRVVLGSFLEEGGWKSELCSLEGRAEFPARRTRQLHIPITVSLIGS